MLKKILLDHPHSVGETYFEHMCQALSFAGVLLMSGVACFVHAFVPGLFQKTAGHQIMRLHQRMVLNRTNAAGDNHTAPVEQEQSELG